MNLVMSFGALS